MTSKLFARKEPLRAAAERILADKGFVSAVEVFMVVNDPEPVVFIVVSDRECAECKAPLPKGSFLFLDANAALCLRCECLDHLVFCASENAKLTLRARKYSSRSPAVVRFSKARNRYERQGVLVDAAALEKAFGELRQLGD